MDGITVHGCNLQALHGISSFEHLMTPQEVNALYVCKQELRCGMDPLFIASTLLGHRWLTCSLHSEVLNMFRQGLEREEINEFLISHIPSNVNLQNFVTVLDECGYQKIATHLYFTYVTGGMRYVYKSTSGQRPAVHKFFRNLKRMVHDAQFQNPRLALRELANRFVDQMQNESNQIRRQQLADKCIAIIGAEIDAIAITFDKHLHEHDVFAQMKQLVSETSNTSITDVVYFGRLANANSIAGDFQNSENMLTEARCRAYNTGPCLELVNMLYIEVYVKLWEFERYPTEILRKQLMMWGRIGLESLEEEDVDTKTLWRRMFILRMVFCLLGIGNRANIIENCPVDDTCLCEARVLLSDIDRSWYGIETRRKMFYYVAKARLCELTGRFEKCIKDIKVARKLAIEGHFEELIFIVQYYENMTQKMGNTLITYIPKEQHPSRNFVMLRPDTSDSSSHYNEHLCILAAADADKNFLLLQLPSEANLSFENFYNVSAEFDTEQNFSIFSDPYIPFAYDDDREIILLKSISSEQLIENSGRFRKGYETEFLNVHTLDSDDQTELQQKSRNLALLRTSQDGLIIPTHGSDTSVNISEQSTHVKFLRFVSKEQQTVFNYHLVLSDYFNSSHNVVILGTNTHEQTLQGNNVDIPLCEHVSPASKFLSLKLETAEQTQELSSFLCHLVSQTARESLQTFNETQSSSKCVFQRRLGEASIFHTTSSSSMRPSHSSSINTSSITHLKHYTPDNVTETSPKVIFNKPTIQDDNKVSFSEKLMTLKINSEQQRDTAVETDIKDATNTNFISQSANTKTRELSAKRESLSNFKSSLTGFNLISTSGMQQLPRYFLVQPQEGSAVIPAPPLEERSSPSGCEQDDSLLAIVNTTAAESGRDNTYFEDQRLNIQLANETSTDTTGCQTVSSGSDFNLIPLDALQELPRFFVVRPEDVTSLNPVHGPPTEDRSQPSGCSMDQLQNLSNQNTDQSSAEIDKLIPTNNAQEQDDTGTQTWSFQSDDMFGD